jgi:SPX domain protein involved in polyphosphate accumulation
VIRRFNRFELKYILPVSQCAAIIDELRHQIAPDHHGGDAGYSIVSLYYDSPAHDFFWAKIEGLKFRRKVRLRIYPGEDITKVTSGSVEIKQRINKTVQKRRLELPIDQAEALCAGKLALTGLDALDMQVASEITYLSRSMDLLPTAITAYKRRAFEGREENAGLRVTFDTQVASRVHALTVNAAAGNRLILPEDWCIMEVKADERVPEWTTSLLARHGCQLHRVSKYCAGVAMLKGIDVLPLALSPGVHSWLPAPPASSNAAVTSSIDPRPERLEEQLEPQPTPLTISEPPHG